MTYDQNCLKLSIGFLKQIYLHALCSRRRIHDRFSVFGHVFSTYVVGILQTAFVAFRHAVIGHGHDDDIERNAECDEELKDQVRYNATNSKKEEFLDVTTVFQRHSYCMCTCSCRFVAEAYTYEIETT